VCIVVVPCVIVVGLALCIVVVVLRVIVVGLAVCIVVVVLCVIVVLCVHCCLFFFTLDAGPLARSQYSEGPATGHLDIGFSWFPCVYKQMLKWFPKIPSCHYMLLM